MRQLKKIANETRGTSLHKEKINRMTTEQEGRDEHPLLRRIENVMNRYTKLS